MLENLEHEVLLLLVEGELINLFVIFHKMHFHSLCDEVGQVHVVLPVLLRQNDGRHASSLSLGQREEVLKKQRNKSQPPITGEHGIVSENKNTAEVALL